MTVDGISTDEKQSQTCLTGAGKGYRARTVEKTICMKSTGILGGMAF